MGARRPRRTKAVLLIVGLAAAVLLVNLAYNLPRFAMPDGGTVPTGVPLFRDVLDPSLRLMLLYAFSLLVVGTVAFLYLRWAPRRALFFHFIPIIALLVLLIAFSVLIVPNDTPPVNEEEEEGGPGGGDEPPPEEETPPVDLFLFEVPAAYLPFLGAALLGASAILVYLFLATLRARSLAPHRNGEGGPGAEEYDFRQQVVSTLEEGLYRLQRGDDLRSAILGCYEELLTLFRGRGIESSSLTAREVERTAGPLLRLSANASTALRELFEVARYSPHRMTERDRRSAAAALREVRAELGG